MPALCARSQRPPANKSAWFTEGEGTEVDKTVIERLSDPITHMLRNAIDHGLEDARNACWGGKGPEGTVKLRGLQPFRAHRHRGSDDGRGINRLRVRELAVERGLIAADAVSPTTKSTT